jgi:hypothetical protein
VAAIVVLATGEAKSAWMSVVSIGSPKGRSPRSIRALPLFQPQAGSGLAQLGEADIQGEDETLSTW